MFHNYADCHYSVLHCVRILIIAFLNQNFQIPIPVHRKTDSSSSDPFPPSPSPTSSSSFPRKFTPPSPRSPRAARPPSPLLSDRRRVAPESSPHSSTSSSPGNDSCLATSRQRTSSLKEKVCIKKQNVDKKYLFFYY